MTHFELELISRCLAGRCTPLERARLDRLLAEAPERLLWVEAVRTVALDRDGDGSAEWKARVTAAMRRRMAAESGGPVPRQVRAAHGNGPRIAGASHRSRSGRLVLIRGSAVAVALGTTILGVKALRSDRGQPAAALAVRSVTTSAGQRAVFRLPDSSRVILGVASTLRHPADFRRSREIILEGEAYFDVVHDERRPFVVRAGNLRAEDLGTQFVMRAYPGEKEARVVVREGRVALRDTRGTAPAQVVHRGQLGRLLAGPLMVEAADTAAEFAWIEGSLVFDRTPLRDALPQLGRWYALEFRLSDSTLGSILLSGTFEAQLTDDALDALAGAMGLRRTRHGRVVTLYTVSPSR